MKALFLGLVIAFAPVFLRAQKSPIKFGNIPMEDMTMTSYAPDSSASAVILCDYGEAYLQSNATSVTLNFERHVRIKILKKEGLEWANAGILLRKIGSTEERVSSLKAVTYSLENGKITETKMSKDGIFKEKFNRNFEIQKFTFPAVKEGSVIEYSYTVISEFYLYFPNWKFQYTIPVRHSEYWAVIPEFFFYEKYMQGYVQVNDYEIKPMSSSSGFATKGHHWTAKEVPAFKEEPYLTSDDDYISKINFALSHIDFPGRPIQEIMGSWKRLNDVLLESERFGGIIKSSGFLKRQVEEITAGMTDPMQKVVAIHNYLKENITWDGDEDYTAINPKKLFEAKKGSSGDINIALASMLERANIHVDMVLLSTRDHGFIRKEYPMEQQFNYAICRAVVGDKFVLLDATEKLLNINTLPKRCLNGEGLVISSTNHGWIKLDTKSRARTVVSADLVLNETGDMKGKLKFTRDGYDAHNMRKNYSTKGEETYLKEFLGQKTWQVEKSEFLDIKNLDVSPKENYDLTIAQHVSVSGDVMYINPFVTEQLAENPFKLESRIYPVDFGHAQDKMYLCKIILPEGYTVDEIPQSKVFILPNNAAKYTYNCTQNGNNVTILSNFQINKGMFVQDEYPNLREFYNQVIAKQTEQIVLRKK